MSHRQTLVHLAAAPLLMLALSSSPALAMGDAPYTDAERASNERFQRSAERVESVHEQDRRSENAADPFRVPLPREWPAYPRALPPAQHTAPVTDGGGDDWLVPVLAVGGSLLLGAGLAPGRIRGQRDRPA